MADAQVVVIALFVGLGGFTFLRLVASARREVIQQVESAARREAARQARREKEARRIPEAKGVNL
jgi:hypothetical protein